MKKSLSIWSVHRLYEQGTLTLEGFADFAQSIGAQGVEMVSFLLKNPKDEMPKFVEILKSRNLELASYSISNDFAKATSEERIEMIEHIKTELDIANSINCKTVRVFSSDFGNGAEFESARAWIVDGLKQTCDYADKYGINICLENHGYFAGTSDQMLVMLNEVNKKNLKVTLDIGNFILMDDDTCAAADKLAPMAALVHVKDFHLVRDYFPLKAYKANSGKKYIGAVIGTGVVDVQYSLKQLKANNYTGFLSLEYDGGESDTRENLQNGMQVLESILTNL